MKVIILTIFSVFIVLIAYIVGKEYGRQENNYCVEDWNIKETGIFQKFNDVTSIFIAQNHLYMYSGETLLLDKILDYKKVE